MEETKANTKNEARAGKEKKENEKRRCRGRGGGGGGGQKERERKREAVGIFARERARVGKRGENKLKAKLYSHKKMELFLDAVPPRYEEKEG